MSPILLTIGSIASMLAGAYFLKGAFDYYRERDWWGCISSLGGTALFWFFLFVLASG